jgi:hypothetical protein
MCWDDKSGVFPHVQEPLSDQNVPLADRGLVWPGCSRRSPSVLQLICRRVGMIGKATQSTDPRICRT